MSEYVETGRYISPWEYIMLSAVMMSPKTMYIIATLPIGVSPEDDFEGKKNRPKNSIGKPAVCRNADNHLLLPPWL